MSNHPTRLPAEEYAKRELKQRIRRVILHPLYRVDQLGAPGLSQADLPRFWGPPETNAPVGKLAWPHLTGASMEPK